MKSHSKREKEIKQKKNYITRPKYLPIRINYSREQALKIYARKFSRVLCYISVVFVVVYETEI